MKKLEAQRLWIRLYASGFKKKFFFLMWTTLKVFVEFVTILLLPSVLVFWLQGVLDLSSQTRDRTLTLCTGR